MAGMKDSHRIMLQSFMSKGMLNATEVKHLFKYANERIQENPAEADLAEFVNTINLNIKPINMEIRKGITEETGKHCYVLVNTTDNDISRAATDYSRLELEYFKKVVEKIVLSEDGQLSSTDALNLTNDLSKRMGLEVAQSLLQRMEQEKWVSISEKGEFVSLTIRTILELDQYLQNSFPDQPITCHICHRICIKGQLCKRCDCKLHLHCAARLFQGKENPCCPDKKCGQPWAHAVPNLLRHREQAATQSSAIESTQQASGTSPSAQERNRSTRKRTR